MLMEWQRRLRHLESIVVRNVYCASLGPRLLNLQYTLHWAESEKGAATRCLDDARAHAGSLEFRTEPFYTSETVHDVTVRGALSAASPRRRLTHSRLCDPRPADGRMARTAPRRH